MIPILYDSTETAFASNGLGRLRDCISCVVTEERNGIYECEFEYPIDGINYDRIQLGRIIAVEHDESNDVQPFDIVSYSRPINGIVTFHAVHISYRQTALTCTGSNINSLADAFTLFGTALPSNPFTYWTDKSSIGFMASADGIPHSVRTMLGGMEGSVIDAYGGEYEWDNWTVKLWSERGSIRNFTIRYGVNLVNYEEELDYSDTYTAVVPYWKGQDQDGNDITIVGDIVQSGYPSFNNGEDRCIPLDVTDKFDTEDGQPTKAQIESEGLAYINANQPYLPAQTLKVDFARITDSPEYAQFANLQKCRLCDSITVVFPRYKTEGVFKIVKTEYDVLQERYLTLELGTLSVTLSEALGINQEAANRVRYGGGGGVDLFYPVGSYYETSDASFDPNVEWGGTWAVKSSFDNGIVLFDNDAQPLSGDITLSDSAANYDRIDICYRTNDSFYDSTSVYTPNNKNAILWTAGVTATTNNHGRVYVKIKVVNITGTTINTRYNNVSGTYYYYTAEKDTAVTGVGTVGDYIAITQVIGYKKVNRWHRTA